MLPNYLLRLDRLVKFGLLGLLFYVPLTTGAGSFNGTKGIIFAVSSFLGIIWLLLLWEEGKIIRVLSANKVVFALMAFFLISGLSFLFYPINIHESVSTFLLVGAYFLTYAIVVSRLKDAKEIGYFIWTLIISAALVAMKALMQYFYEFRFLAEHIALRGIPLNLENRVFATFISPNALAGFLLLSLPISLILSETAKDSQKKLFAFILSMLILSGLLLTFSKAGWVIVIVLLLMLVVLLPSGIRRGILTKLVVLTVLAALFTLVGFLFLPEFKAALARLLSQQITLASFKGRIDFWESSIKIFMAYPFLGSGLGTFASIFPQFQVSGNYSQHAHNTYLEMFAEVGLIGGFIFILLLGTSWIRSVYSCWRKKDEKDKAITIGLIVGAFGFILHNMLDYDWYVPATGLFFWAYLGLSLSLDRKEGGFEKAFRKTNAAIRLSLWIILLSLAGILMWKFLALAEADEYAQRGKDALRVSMWDASVINFKKAVELDPIKADYRASLAQSYSSQAVKSGDKANLVRAVGEIKEAIKLQPYSAKFHGLLGNYYFQLGEVKQALVEWRKAKKLYPKNPVYYTLLGRALMQLERRGEAAQEFRGAISLAGYYRTGRVGIPLLKREVQSEPSSIYDAYLYLATLALDEEKEEEARDLYNKAINFSPRDVAAYDGLADILFQKGEQTQAIEVYQKILEIDEMNLDARFNLGMLYEQVGQYDQAAHEYRSILRVKPEYREAKEALERLLKK